MSLNEAPPTYGPVGWFYNPAPKSEASLIAKAGTGEWNVHVAIFNDKKNWDSRFGKNYVFRF
jgi:hypothetical protein